MKKKALILVVILVVYSFIMLCNANESAHLTTNNITSSTQIWSSELLSQKGMVTFDKIEEIDNLEIGDDPIILIKKFKIEDITSLPDIYTFSNCLYFRVMTESEAVYIVRVGLDYDSDIGYYTNIHSYTNTDEGRINLLSEQNPITKDYFYRQHELRVEVSQNSNTYKFVMYIDDELLGDVDIEHTSYIQEILSYDSNIWYDINSDLQPFYVKSKTYELTFCNDGNCDFDEDESYDEGYQIGYSAGQATCDSNDDTNSECATFDIFSNTLHVPCFDGGETTYWLDLSLINGDPLTL